MTGALPLLCFGFTITTRPEFMGHLELVRENCIDVLWQSRDHGRLHGLPSQGKTTIGSGLGVGSGGARTQY